MIFYHGGPIWPKEVGITFWQRRHAFVSFYRPEQVAILAEQSESFAIDNGAFSFWRLQNGARVDLEGYREFVDRWSQHPGCDWHLIPDVIDGTASENDALIARWPYLGRHAVPVWHLHEAVSRLIDLARSFPRVALGSSGSYAKIGTASWKARMAEAMETICNAEGFPHVKLHGLRMMSSSIFKHIPLSSADSTNVARNIVIDKAWRGPYAPTQKEDRAIIIANNVSAHPSARRWARSFGQDVDLYADIMMR